MSLPQGITAREEKTTSDRLNTQSQITKYPIGIKTPLRKGKLSKESLFRMNFEIESQISDNLKNLLMTKKGERLCFTDYGTRLYEIYSSDASMEEIYQFAMKEIKESVQKYMPSISLVNYYSSLKKDKAGWKDIESDESKYDRFKRGDEFLKIQNTMTTTGKGSIEKSSEAKEKTDLIYLITVEYSIPRLDPKKVYSISVNLITSK